MVRSSYCIYNILVQVGMNGNLIGSLKLQAQAFNLSKGHAHVFLKEAASPQQSDPLSVIFSAGERHRNHVQTCVGQWIVSGSSSNHHLHQGKKANSEAHRRSDGCHESIVTLHCASGKLHRALLAHHPLKWQPRRVPVDSYT